MQQQGPTEAGRHAPSALADLGMLAKGERPPASAERVSPQSAPVSASRLRRPSAAEGRAPGELGVGAQLLLDAQQLVVLGGAIGA